MIVLHTIHIPKMSWGLRPRLYASVRFADSIVNREVNQNYEQN